MIIFNIVGGLGNQMFQYACGRALSLDLKLPLKFTQDMFEIYKLHYGPELERVFSLTVDVAQPYELKKTIGILRIHPSVRRVLINKHFIPIRGKQLIIEPHSNYWNKLPDNARFGGYIQGYWQSELYFIKYETVIRNDFKFRTQLMGRNAEIARKILDTQSISVHIRRGDYVTNLKTLAYHGVCELDYYINAIESLRSRIPQASFFVFSDEFEWVTDMLLPRFPDLILVNQNKNEYSYNDMHLMSLCKHHIIANSSFSWWGAWLNASPAKIVIAPKQWFSNNNDTHDLLPSSWERL